MKNWLTHFAIWSAYTALICAAIWTCTKLGQFWLAYIWPHVVTFGGLIQEHPAILLIIFAAGAATISMLQDRK